MKTRVCYNIELSTYIRFKKILKNQNKRIEETVADMVTRYVAANSIPIVCPMCGSNDIHLKEYITYIDYKCNNCNQRWRASRND